MLYRPLLLALPLCVFLRSAYLFLCSALRLRLRSPLCFIMCSPGLLLCSVGVLLCSSRLSPNSSSFFFFGDTRILRLISGSGFPPRLLLGCRTRPLLFCLLWCLINNSSNLSGSRLPLGSHIGTTPCRLDRLNHDVGPTTTLPRATKCHAEAPTLTPCSKRSRNGCSPTNRLRIYGQDSPPLKNVAIRRLDYHIAESTSELKI
mmetsp:Transcript_11386/g.19123  ORF Transcript_11386/g.19123 Transcript_11386/m.19123 type:complete len:203 (-) Transcript_11386:65-673(-)